ncbi:histidinol-phosphate aminotransferase 2 [Komagataeibacter europaeus]|uniref:Histidinol-phosphate aminotransferase n=1 Tax=Komagataeibacter europaeus TaxID=33995 RepID=A0A0M0EGG0_KOMEU|nr:histidinol-phosphate transaminase [Komagataeibacter europaeus]KON64345.1 histidinol-phosphate aminotransferase 2 [Komagataeibacter europaeus]
MAASSSVPTRSIRVLARPEVAALPVYNAGLSEDEVRQKYNASHISKLGSNENPYGPSPAALKQWENLTRQLFRYPDATASTLRHALAQATGTPADHIMLGNGSEQIIRLICEAYLSPGDRVVTVLPSFGLHVIWPEMMGARVDAVPITAEGQFDLPAMKRAVQAAPLKILMFSNPSNPVGCMMNATDMLELVACCPQDTLIVIDEAYYEYALGSPDYPDATKILPRQARPWLVLRTFSKAYALAGLRIGYALASDTSVIGTLNKVRDPFNTNMAAQDMALACLHDRTHMHDSVATTVAERARFMNELTRQGYAPVPSHTNFIFLDVGQNASALAERLLRHGVIIKPWREKGFETCLRVSVGLPADNDRFLRALSIETGQTDDSH